MRRSWTPSIVPNGDNQTIYLVLNDFGQLGRAYCEASEDRSDLETTIADLISGQYDNPVRVVAFNTAERWSDDVSEDIAREIMLAFRQPAALAGSQPYRRAPSSLLRGRRLSALDDRSVRPENGRCPNSLPTP
jgi:hypothetical protein